MTPEEQASAARKLIEARMRIEAILTEMDIAALVVLNHPPGAFETFRHLETSYSILKVEGEGYRLRARLAEDYRGDKELMEYHMAATASMLSGMCSLMGPNVLKLMELSDFVDEQLGATHTPMVPVEPPSDA